MAEFTNDEIKEYIRGALRTRTSDNLERCELVFKGLDNKQMQIEHGSSGRSRQEILEGYQKERRLYNATIQVIQRAGLY